MVPLKQHVSCVWCACGLALALGASTARSQVYDLATDWSVAANPNGAWSYHNGDGALPFQPCYTAIGSPCQPAWALVPSGYNHIPVWFKAVGSYNLDWLPGDVVTHSADQARGNSRVSNVKWTCPASGFVDITGAIWLARQIGRSNTCALALNSDIIANGLVYTGDGHPRADPWPLVSGAASPVALTGLPVAAGDVIGLYVAQAPGSAFGDFTGVNLPITFVAAACPADFNQDGGIDGGDVQYQGKPQTARDFCSEMPNRSKKGRSCVVGER